MLTDQDAIYHRERVQTELDLAYQAEHTNVAHAHMKLAALHMARLKREDELCAGVGGRAFR